MNAVFRSFAVASTIALITAPIGCASDSRRVTREDTVRTTSPDSSAEAEGDSHNGQVVEHHTTVTDEHKDQGGGVISTTVAFVGEVIAFPFRLVGAAFRAIF